MSEELEYRIAELEQRVAELEYNLKRLTNTVQYRQMHDKEDGWGFWQIG